MGAPQQRHEKRWAARPVQCSCPLQRCRSNALWTSMIIARQERWICMFGACCRCTCRPSRAPVSRQALAASARGRTGRGSRTTTRTAAARGARQEEASCGPARRRFHRQDRAGRVQLPPGRLHCGDAARPMQACYRWCPPGLGMVARIGTQRIRIRPGLPNALVALHGSSLFKQWQVGAGHRDNITGVRRCRECRHLPLEDREMSGTQFESHAGSASAKKWKTSLRVEPGSCPEVPPGGWTASSLSCIRCLLQHCLLAALKRPLARAESWGSVVELEVQQQGSPAARRLSSARRLRFGCAGRRACDHHDRQVDGPDGHGPSGAGAAAGQQRHGQQRRRVGRDHPAGEAAGRRWRTPGDPTHIPRSRWMLTTILQTTLQVARHFVLIWLWEDHSGKLSVGIYVVHESTARSDMRHSPRVTLCWRRTRSRRKARGAATVAHLTAMKRTAKRTMRTKTRKIRQPTMTMRRTQPCTSAATSATGSGRRRRKGPVVPGAGWGVCQNRRRRRCRGSRGKRCAPESSRPLTCAQYALLRCCQVCLYPCCTCILPAHVLGFDWRPFSA